MPASQLDILVAELALVAGRIEREAGLRLDAIVSEIKRSDAERALAFANLCRDLDELKQQVAGRLASIKDGEPGEKGDPGTPGKDGVGITVDDVAPLIASEVARAVSALPAPEKGEPGEKGDPGTPGKDGVPGLLPIVKAWADEVHYAGTVVTHAGATWQALRDTAKQPPHEDWICIAAAGIAGKDGRSPNVRGTFAADVEDYRELDVVALGGAAFIARRDNPGTCPGDGWQVISTQGKSGKPGERGGVGPRGEAGPAVCAAHVDDQGLVTLVNADGSKVELDLYPVLAKLH